MRQKAFMASGEVLPEAAAVNEDLTGSAIERASSSEGNVEDMPGLISKQGAMDVRGYMAGSFIFTREI